MAITNSTWPTRCPGRRGDVASPTASGARSVGARWAARHRRRRSARYARRAGRAPVDPAHRCLSTHAVNSGHLPASPSPGPTIPSTFVDCCASGGGWVGPVQGPRLIEFGPGGDLDDDDADDGDGSGGEQRDDDDGFGVVAGVGFTAQLVERARTPAATSAVRTYMASNMMDHLRLMGFWASVLREFGRRDGSVWAGLGGSGQLEGEGEDHRSGEHHGQ